MPTSYTSLLGLALPVQGELTGTWGDTVNDYITKYVDASVAGTQTISGSQTAVTLSTTNGSTLTQAGSGATGSAQYMIINCTGNPASLLTITAPATSKAYIIINATSTSQSVKIVATGPTTGVTVAAGTVTIVAWNGSDFVNCVEGNVTLNGTQTLTNKTLTDPAIIGTILEDVYTISDGAAFEVDPGNGSVQLITLGANRTPKATNFAAGEAITLMVDDGSAYTITWTDATWGGSGVVWMTDGGAAPTLNTSGYTTIVLWKVSTQVYGARVGNA